MFARMINFIGMAIVTLILIWVIGYLWFASAIAFGSHNVTPEKSEAIVVLTGGHGRISAGIDLFSEKRAPLLFISGVHKDTNKQDILTNQTPSPSSNIELGHNATDTLGNAAEVKTWVNENDIKKIILVTSRYHMPRAYMLISRSIPHVQISKYVTDTEEFKAWQGRFWELTFSEYNKILVQWLELNGR